MTATEELCRLLDERGVKYSYEDVTEGTLFVVTRDVRIYFILVRREKGFKVWSDWLTPKQAVDATLGRGTCKRVMDSIDPFGMWVCDHCGHPLDTSESFCGGCGAEVMTE